jgi:hypothetical protein
MPGRQAPQIACATIARRPAPPRPAARWNRGVRSRGRRLMSRRADRGRSAAPQVRAARGAPPAPAARTPPPARLGAPLMVRAPTCCPARRDGRGARLRRQPCRRRQQRRAAGAAGAAGGSPRVPQPGPQRLAVRQVPQPRAAARHCRGGHADGRRLRRRARSRRGTAAAARRRACCVEIGLEPRPGRRGARHRPRAAAIAAAAAVGSSRAGIGRAGRVGSRRDRAAAAAGGGGSLWAPAAAARPRGGGVLLAPGRWPAAGGAR